MNPNDQVIKDALVNLINSTYEQLPSVLQQLLQWQCISDIMTIIISSLFFIGSLLGIYIIWKRNQKTAELINGKYIADEYETTEFMITVILSIFASVSFFIIIGNSYDLIQLIVTPKAWLLEYAQNFIKHIN